MTYRNQEPKPFLEQLTDFIDVIGKHGVGVALVAMCLLYILFWHPENNSWQTIIGYIVAVPGVAFGSYIEYRKLFLR